MPAFFKSRANKTGGGGGASNPGDQQEKRDIDEANEEEVSISESLELHNKLRFLFFWSSAQC